MGRPESVQSAASLLDEHPPPLWIRGRDHIPATIDRLTTGGPVLGVLEAASYPVEQIRAAPGDVLVLFSDRQTSASGTVSI